MKYIINESKLISFLDKVIEDSVGKLEMKPLLDINAREDDFKLVNSTNETIFTYMDYELSVNKNLYYTLGNLFNLKEDELRNLIQKWFEKNYPGHLVIGVYYSPY
jgi:hypothetical protein